MRRRRRGSRQRPPGLAQSPTHKSMAIPTFLLPFRQRLDIESYLPPKQSGLLAAVVHSSHASSDPTEAVTLLQEKRRARDPTPSRPTA